MIVDASALIAIIKDEPEAAEIAAALEREVSASISAATLFEACVVADGAPDPRSRRALDHLVRAAGLRIEPFTEQHAVIAREAYAVFGKDSGHPAKLNLGDCFAYATAYAANETLLYKGDDFAQTDIKSALKAD